MASKKPWAEKHVRCAKAAALRLQAECLEAGGTTSEALDARRFARIAASDFDLSNEWNFCVALAHAGAPDIDREVRRVRARAEGRVSSDEVVVFWRVRRAGVAIVPRVDGSKEDAESFILRRDPRETLHRVTHRSRRILCAPARVPCPKCGGATISWSSSKGQPLTLQCADGHSWAAFAPAAATKGAR